MTKWVVSEAREDNMYAVASTFGAVEFDAYQPP